jgi:hypothetical protein
MEFKFTKIIAKKDRTISLVLDPPKPTAAVAEVAQPKEFKIIKKAKQQYKNNRYFGLPWLSSNKKDKVLPKHTSRRRRRIYFG